MSVEHLAAVLHHSRAQGTVKLILLGIANHAGDGGSWPSLRTLAVYAHVDVRTVRRALRRAEELGELRSHVQAGGDHRHAHPYERPNLYEVLVECPEGCAGGANHRPRPGWRRHADGTFAPVDNPSKDPRTPVSGGGASVPPPPDARVPLTIPQTVDNHRSLSTTDRARGTVGVVEATLAVHDSGLLEANGARLDPSPCQECAAPNELTCLRRQLKLSTEDRHAYDNGHSPAVGEDLDTVAERRTEDEGGEHGG